MYIPPSFKVEDFEKLTAVIQQNSFATLVTCAEGEPFASHLPTLFEAQRAPLGTVLCHMARANPQWRHFANGKEALMIFQGPHTYISPSWYQTQLAVPTWNYVAVHAYGIPLIIEDEAEVETMLDKTILQYEGTGEGS